MSATIEYEPRGRPLRRQENGGWRERWKEPPVATIRPTPAFVHAEPPHVVFKTLRSAERPDMTEKIEEASRRLKAAKAEWVSACKDAIALVNGSAFPEESIADMYKQNIMMRFNAQDEEEDDDEPEAEISAQPEEPEEEEPEEEELEGEEEQAEPQLKIGDTVVIDGLKRTVKYNKQVATITEVPDEEGGRFSVKTNGADRLLVKRENIQPAQHAVGKVMYNHSNKVKFDATRVANVQDEMVLVEIPYDDSGATVRVLVPKNMITSY